MFVIKIGGGEGTDMDKVLSDLVNFKDFVLVHGGSHDTNLISEKLGRPPKHVTSVSGITSRYTDRETLDIFSMVYAGKINVNTVSSMQKLGINAVGLTGVDGRLLEGKRKDTIKVLEGGKRKVLRDDYTGKIERVNTPLLRLLLDAGYTPVITLPAISYEGEPINADGDIAAAACAVSLGASDLVILSNVPGLLRDPDDPTSLIKRIRKDQLDDYEHLAKGRFKKKLMGAKRALEGGVSRVIIAGTGGEKPVSLAFSGEGTVIQ